MSWDSPTEKEFFSTSLCVVRDPANNNTNEYMKNWERRHARRDPRCPAGTSLSSSSARYIDKNQSHRIIDDTTPSSDTYKQ